MRTICWVWYSLTWSLLHHVLLPVLKAWVKGSIWIPIFDVDNKLDAGTLARKVTNFVMGIRLYLLACPLLFFFLHTVGTNSRYMQQISMYQYKSIEIDLMLSCAGGWWSGIPSLSYDRCHELWLFFWFVFCVWIVYSLFLFFNSQFLAKVEEKFPNDTDLIVACQKGLRWALYIQVTVHFMVSCLWLSCYCEQY